MVLVLVTFGLLVSFNILYTNYATRVGDARWCDLMVGLDDRYQKLETKDPDALDFRNRVHKLRQDLRCPPSPIEIPTLRRSP